MTERQQGRWQEDQVKLFRFMHLPFPYRRPKSNWQRNPNRSKIISLSDPHVKFENTVVFSHVEKHEKDAGLVIIPGDLGDYYSKSRFRKTRHVSFAKELKAVFRRIEWLATNWESVKIMIGNHDNRPEKHAIGLIAQETDMLIMTEANMLDRLCGWFDNVELVGTQLDKTEVNLTHIYQYGDITFTHGELSREQGTAILDKVEKWIRDWSTLLQLKQFTVLAQAHNHRGIEESMHYGKRFLLPTASNPFSVGFEYIYGSRMVGKPPAIGYTQFYQERGRTDINRSHNIVFEVRNGKTQPLR